MPRWMMCFVIAAAAVALQYFPMPGIYLMLLMAPFWSVILVNLGFVLLARDVWVGDAPRWLAALPILWFGCYGIVAAISHWNAYQFNRSITEANASKRVTWDKSQYGLLIGQVGLDSMRMLDQYPVQEVFWKAAPNDPTRVARLLTFGCPGTLLTPINGNSYSAVGEQDAKSRLWFHTRDLCRVVREERPSKKVVQISPGRADEKIGWLNAYRRQETIITAPGQRPVTVYSGTVTALSWLPQPIAGCGLDSGAPAWRCFAQFNREPVVIGSDESGNRQENIITRALGITKATLRERYAVNWTHN